MAYNDYAMGGFAATDYEDEEQRRRRLAAEQAQAQAQDLESGGITAQRPGGFMDAVGQYATNRFNAAQQRLTDAGQIVTDPEAALRRRMGMLVADTEQPVEPTPVKQTITTDPRTGEQKMKIEGSVQDLSSANPLTPTVNQPVTPGQAVAQDQQAQAQLLMQMPDAQQREQAAVERMRAAAAATQPAPEAEPTGPSIPQGLVAGGGVPARADIGQVPTPGPAVQVAQAGTVNPVVQQAPAAAPGANLQQVAQAQTAQAVSEDPARQAVYDARNEKDPNQRRDRYVQVLQNPNVDSGTKALAERFIAEDYIKQRDIDQANQKIAEATPTDLARYMKEQKKEGSYVKAILFSRLGLNALAQQEMELLSPSLTMTNMIDDKNNRYAVELDKNGKITRAFDANGKSVNQETKAKLQASGGTLKGVEVEAGAYKDPTGQVAGSFVLERRPGGSVFREVGTNRIATPAESAVLNKTGVQGTLSDQRLAQVQRQNIELAGDWERLRMKVQGAGPEAANKFIGEFNAKHKTNYALGQIQGSAPQINADTGQIATATVAPVQTTATSAAPVQTTATSATSVAPVQTTATSVAPVQTTATSVAPVQTVVTGTGTSPADVANASALKLEAGKSVIETREDLEKQRNKLRVNQPAAEGNADSLLRTLNDVMTHPGFDKTVGNPDILNKPLQMIPQGDRRAFKQKYDQLAGQQFLAAFNQLKGGGSITEVEGAKAEQAIAALKDTGISSEEFKKNAYILRDVVQTGIDNQRRQLGQTSKYAESADREAAKEWLRNNPNDPKASAVRKKLVGY